MQPLNDNPRLGFESKNPALHPGHNVCQSTVALRLSWSVASEARQSEVMGRFMTPDPSGLAFADPTNPQSLNLYSYVLNNPLTNIDPTGLDCVQDNGDGTVTTNTGDCGNENEAAANAQHYIDCDGCTSGATGANLDAATGNLYLTDANGNGISGTTVSDFADPQGTPATDVTVNGSAPYLDTISGYGVLPDIDSQRIQQVALGVVNFGIPSVCNFGLNARLGAGRVSVWANLSTENLVTKTW